MRNESNISGHYVILAGITEAARGFIILIILQTWWSEKFTFLSFNLDILAFYSAMLSVWLVAYLQLSRENIHTHQCITKVFYPTSYVIATFYFITSLFIFREQDEQSLDTIIFILLRALSLLLFARIGIHQCIFIQQKNGVRVLAIQAAFLASSTIIYILLGSSQEQLVLMGVSLLVSECGITCMTRHLAKPRDTGITNILQPVKKPSFLDSWNAQKLIVAYELGSAIAIAASMLFIISAIYQSADPNYLKNRVALGFMSVMWLITSKVINLMLCNEDPKYSTSLLKPCMQVWQLTWYVPVVLAITASLLYLPSAQVNSFISACTAIAYYPLIAVTIAVIAIIRTQGNNQALYRTNWYMLFLYFIPLAYLLATQKIPSILVVHIIGASYAIRCVLLFRPSRHKD